MDEERMAILKMVSEEKIVPEEAELLLRTLEEVDAPKQDASRQSTPKDQQEGMTELLKSGAEALKNQVLNIKAEVLKSQDKFLREQGQILKKTLTQAKRDKHRTRREFNQIKVDGRVCHEEPRQEQRISTAEKVDLDLDHRHGSIDIASWAENDVHVTYQKIVWAEDEKAAKAIASEIEIQIDCSETPAADERTLVSIETLYPEHRELWQSRRKARVNYWLKVPQQTKLAVDNQHGNVSIQNLHGKTTIGNRHGNVSAHVIDGDLTLDVHHGNIDADTIQGDVQLESAHGSANLGKVGGSVEGDGAHGRLRLHEVQGNLTLAHRHGNIEVDQVHGAIRIEQRYGGIELDGVRDTFHIDSQHSRIDLNIVSPLRGDCVIRAHHGPVDLVVPVNAFASIQASTHHGKISSEFEGNHISKKHDQEFTATPHDSGATLQITNYHGGIDLCCREAVPQERDLSDREVSPLLDAVATEGEPDEQ